MGSLEEIHTMSVTISRKCMLSMTGYGTRPQGVQRKLENATGAEASRPLPRGQYDAAGCDTHPQRVQRKLENTKGAQASRSLRGSFRKSKRMMFSRSLVNSITARTNVTAMLVFSMMLTSTQSSQMSNQPDMGATDHAKHGKKDLEVYAVVPDGANIPFDEVDFLEGLGINVRQLPVTEAAKALYTKYSTQWNNELHEMAQFEKELTTVEEEYDAMLNAHDSRLRWDPSGRWGENIGVWRGAGTVGIVRAGAHTLLLGYTFPVATAAGMPDTVNVRNHTCPRSKDSFLQAQNETKGNK